MFDEEENISPHTCLMRARKENDQLWRLVNDIENMLCQYVDKGEPGTFDYVYPLQYDAIKSVVNSIRELKGKVR